MQRVVQIRLAEGAVRPGATDPRLELRVVRVVRVMIELDRDAIRALDRLWLRKLFGRRVAVVNLGRLELEPLPPDDLRTRSRAELALS